MRGGTIFLFAFEICLCRQPYCLLGSVLFVLAQLVARLVRPKRFYATISAITDQNRQQTSSINWTDRVTRFEFSLYSPL